MTDEARQNESTGDAERADDTRADARVVITVFITAVLMALHFVSGFSFDF